MAAAGAPGVGADVAVGQPILQDRILQASTVCAADDRDFISEILAGSLPLDVDHHCDPELALSLQAAANLGEAAAAAAAAHRRFSVLPLKLHSQGIGRLGALLGRRGRSCDHKKASI